MVSSLSAVINKFKYLRRYFGFMAKQKSTETDVDGETSLQYILEEDDSHLPLTEQKFLRILVNPVDVLKSIGPKLVPFAKTACVYFVAGLNRPSILNASLKCLPIICLCFFIGMQGIKSEHRYNRHVLLGMMFSCLGDALMVWKPRLFIHSMVAFAIAQIIYVKAFGMRPFSFKTCVVCSVYGLLCFWVCYPRLKGVMLISVAIYSVLIMAMCWRAVTRLQIDKLWKWNNMCACGGALLFAISDTLIALDKFYAPIIYRNGIVMTTYYLAQLGIAMSTCKHNINDVVLNLHPETCKKGCLKEYKKN